MAMPMMKMTMTMTITMTMMMTITLITTLGIMVIMLTYDDASGAESSEFPFKNSIICHLVSLQVPSFFLV